MRAPLALALCLLAGDAAANPFTPNLDAQRRAAESMMPAQLHLPQPVSGFKSTVTVRIRFYADDEYRAGLFRWADRAKTQLAELNKVIEPAFGIRFEGESFRRWHRSSNNIDIFKMVDELEKQDIGPDVDWVVALVSPLSLITTSMHEIGAARLLGRHFVLRGMANVDEANAFGKNLDLLDPAEREQLYARRKWHKECAVFLHEWLHTLGAIHSNNPEHLTNPSYSNRMSTLSTVDADLVAIALRARLAARQGEVDWSELRAAVERTESPDWFSKEREELLNELRAHGGTRGGRAAGPPVGARGGLSKDEAERFNHAVDLMKENKTEEAWTEAQPLAPRHESNVDVQRLLCRLSFVRPSNNEGMAACARARELAPGMPEPLVDAAQARILRKELAEALAATDEAAARARARSNGKDKDDVWVWIAQLYGQLGAISRAEEALDHADEKMAGYDKARTALLRDRRFLGMPRTGVGKGTTVDKELDYADRHRRAVALIDGGKLREARTLVDAARRDFPDVPGLEVLSCEIDARQGKFRQADKACAHALSVMPDLARAHYLLGHIKLQTNARDAAIKAFRRSIDLDPGESPPYQSLADIYRISGKREELAALRAEYEKVFSKPLR